MTNSAADAFDAVARPLRQGHVSGRESSGRDDPLSRFYRAIDRHFRRGAALLELGCGTGDDALALASRGYRVVATDVAAGMVERARAKVTAGRMGPRRAVSGGAARRRSPDAGGRTARASRACTRTWRRSTASPPSVRCAGCSRKRSPRRTVRGRGLAARLSAGDRALSRSRRASRGPAPPRPSAPGRRRWSPLPAPVLGRR